MKNRILTSILISLLSGSIYAASNNSVDLIITFTPYNLNPYFFQANILIGPCAEDSVDIKWNKECSLPVIANGVPVSLENYNIGGKSILMPGFTIEFNQGMQILVSYDSSCTPYFQNSQVRVITDWYTVLVAKNSLGNPIEGKVYFSFNLNLLEAYTGLLSLQTSNCTFNV